MVNKVVIFLCRINGVLVVDGIAIRSGKPGRWNCRAYDGKAVGFDKQVRQRMRNDMLCWTVMTVKIKKTDSENASVFCTHTCSTTETGINRLL